MKVGSLFLIICFVVMGSGCASLSSDHRIDHIANIAKGARFRHRVVTTSTFAISIFYRVESQDKPLRVYIEGDGYAWITASRPSGDPTPRDPLALRLAAMDAYPNLLYLARPCQITRNDSLCKMQYWTSHRYAEEVVVSIEETISKFIEGGSFQGVELIGFSGGGAVAMLVAARRSDITSVRTIAANLDHVSVNRHHGVSQLIDSLNPIDYAQQLADVPQRHFAGSNDKIVPPFIVESFQKAAGNDRCVRVSVVPGASHADIWARKWNTLLRMSVECY